MKIVASNQSQSSRGHRHQMSSLNQDWDLYFHWKSF